MGRAARALYAIAAGLGLVGLALWIVPAPASPLPTPPPLTRSVWSPPDVPLQRQELEALQQIVAGNILSATRSAPHVRFTPPGLAITLTSGESATGARATTRMSLYGTVVGPDGAIALIDADPRIHGAEIYRVGDRLGARQVAEITDSTVVLSGPSGRLVLRLPREARNP